ncbi:MAG TPA: LpqB family beta-propeller domain-containing protein [Angustibacter sp.]|nr:LpqB family beta-propeller domain-containing protein [Angustibacter sp.]
MRARGPRERSARALAAVLAAVLLPVLAACGGSMPDSGQAGAGREIGDVSADPLRVVPEGPAPGAEPAAVVSGFLRAGAGFDDDHAVARTFLTTEASSVWNPAQGTVIYPDDTSLSVVTRAHGRDREVVVTAPVWAVIDRLGQLELARPGTTASTSFEVTSTDGEWRVGTLQPDLGLWMPRYEFERAYTPLRLYFAATGTRTLVPDLRWFAGPRAGLATEMVRSLLAGPAPYLRGAVTSGAPGMTTLGVDAVPTSDGTAQIDLSSSALTATPEQRQQLWAQLTASLRQLPTVSGISLTAEGAAYPVAGLPDKGAGGDLGYAEDVRVAGPVVVLSDGRLRQVDPGTGALAGAPTGRFAGIEVAGVRAVAAGTDDDLLLAVDSSGRRLLALAAQQPPTRLYTGTDLANPVVDVRGWAWTADRGRAGALAVVASTSSTAAAADDTTSVRELRPGWLSGRRVLALDVSRDGSRLAVVSATPDGASRLQVAGIVRDGTGRPVGLAIPRSAASSLTTVRDVSWADRTNLAVLAGAPGQVQPYQVEVGGLVEALPKVQDAVSISAGDGLRAVYVVTGSGRVLVRTGNGWRSLGPGTSVTIPQ